MTPVEFRSVNDPLPLEIRTSPPLEWCKLFATLKFVSLQTVSMLSSWTALQRAPLEVQIFRMGRYSPVLSPRLTLPCSKLLGEGLKRAELKQETKLNPLFPAFVQCQKHSRNCLPAKDQASYFSLVCSTLLSSCRDGVELGTLWFPHTVRSHSLATGEQRPGYCTLRNLNYGSLQRLYL